MSAKTVTRETLAALDQRWPCLSNERHTFAPEATSCLCGALWRANATQSPEVVLYTPNPRVLPEQPSLDVERLVRVLENIDMGRFWREEPRQLHDAPLMRRMTFQHRWFAERIAAEYTRLAGDAR